MTVKSPARSSARARARAPKARSVRPGDADFYRGDDYPIKDSVGYLLKQLRATQERLVDAEMAEHDLTGVQWGPLLIIHYGLGTTAAEIARWACVDTGAVTRMLDRIEAKGLVRRTPCPNDRRVTQLELTAEGERLCREIPYGLARVSNGLLRGFTREEFEALKDFLRRMLANADRR
jgi:DNA-binding MarR family transcriptional regulator